MGDLFSTSEPISLDQIRRRLGNHIYELDIFSLTLLAQSSENPQIPIVEVEPKSRTRWQLAKLIREADSERSVGLGLAIKDLRNIFRPQEIDSRRTLLQLLAALLIVQANHQQRDSYTAKQLSGLRKIDTEIDELRQDLLAGLDQFDWAQTEVRAHMEVVAELLDGVDKKPITDRLKPYKTKEVEACPINQSDAATVMLLDTQHPLRQGLVLDLAKRFEEFDYSDDLVVSNMIDVLAAIPIRHENWDAIAKKIIDAQLIADSGGGADLESPKILKRAAIKLTVQTLQIQRRANVERAVVTKTPPPMLIAGETPALL